MSQIDHSVTAIPKITVSRLIPINVTKCWELMSNFVVLPTLPPDAVTYAEQELKPDQVGFIRNIDIAQHDLHIRETLRSLDHASHTLSYDICSKNDSFLPGTSNYLAKYQFFAVGDDQAFGYWSVYFDQEGTIRCCCSLTYLCAVLLYLCVVVLYLSLGFICFYFFVLPFMLFLLSFSLSGCP
jgi:hypothetical protein